MMGGYTRVVFQGTKYSIKDSGDFFLILNHGNNCELSLDKDNVDCFYDEAVRYYDVNVSELLSIMKCDIGILKGIVVGCLFGY